MRQSKRGRVGQPGEARGQHMEATITARAITIIFILNTATVIIIIILVIITETILVIVTIHVVRFTVVVRAAAQAVV